VDSTPIYYMFPTHLPPSLCVTIFLNFKLTLSSDGMKKIIRGTCVFSLPCCFYIVILEILRSLNKGSIREEDEKKRVIENLRNWCPRTA
jgi:hypothetical protein